VTAEGKMTVGTKLQYAKHRGCGPSYITKLIKNGTLAEPALMADGRVNFILADQMIGKPSSADAESLFATPYAGAPNFAEERARREAAEAQLAEIKLQEKQRELLKSEAVAQAATSVFGRAMARFSEAWAELAVVLAPMTDPAAIADRLADEQRRVMAGLHKEFMEDAANRSAA
jgi:hypothetical protein